MTQSVESTPYFVVRGKKFTAAPASAPVLPEMSDEELERELEASDERRALRWHFKLWQIFCSQQLLPESWRGRLDIFHYELLLFGFKERLEGNRHKGIRVRWRKWMRRGLSESDTRVTRARRIIWREDQTAALKWFSELSPKQRAGLVADMRAEEAERRAEARRIKRANQRHRAKLELLSGRHT